MRYSTKLRLILLLLLALPAAAVPPLRVDEGPVLLHADIDQQWGGHTFSYLLEGERALFWSATMYNPDGKTWGSVIGQYPKPGTGGVPAVTSIPFTDPTMFSMTQPLMLRSADGGVFTTLGTHTTTVAEDTWYKLRAVLDGTSVKIYWGAEGASFNKIISATTTKTTTGRACYIRAQANSEHGFDNIQLIAGTRSTTETFTYNNANEQITHAKNGVTTTMTYDDWGRLATRDDGTHDATYAYRYGSKLYSLTSDFPGEGSVTYETGGDGTRRSRVAGADETWYNYTAGFDVVSTENNADGSSGALSKMNVVAMPTVPVSATLADLAGTTPSSGTARYYVSDHLASTRSTWNASKAKLGSYEFESFGGEFNYTGAEFASLAGAYTGKPWDSISNLFHFPYRLYSSDLARWTSRDTLGMVDGPNTYAYVSNEPNRRVDRMGLRGDEAFGKPDGWVRFGGGCKGYSGFYLLNDLDGRSWKSYPVDSYDEYVSTDYFYFPGGPDNVLKVPGSWTCEVDCYCGGIEMSCWNRNGRIWLMKLFGRYDEPRPPRADEGVPRHPDY